MADRQRIRLVRHPTHVRDGFLTCYPSLHQQSHQLLQNMSGTGNNTIITQDIGRNCTHGPAFHHHRRRPHRPARAQSQWGPPRDCLPSLSSMPNVCSTPFNHDQGPEPRPHRLHKPPHRASWIRQMTPFSLNPIAKITQVVVHRGRGPPPINGNARSHIMIQVGRRSGEGGNRGRTLPDRARIRTMSLLSRTMIRSIRSTHPHWAYFCLFSTLTASPYIYNRYSASTQDTTLYGHHSLMAP